MLFLRGFRGQKTCHFRVALLLSRISDSLFIPMRMRLIVMLLLLPPAALAGEILASSVNHEGAVYSLSVTARIDAPLDTVYRSITDFENLAAINPAIEESQLLATPAADTQRVRSVIRVCILMFCKRVEQVQEVTLMEGYAITAVILPQGGDFRSGVAHWQLTASGAATEMLFTNSFEPDFWVPPVIGPWMIKRKLTQEVAATAMYIEVQEHEPQ
ncbi:MAG: SRPBCC family protein [Gammaproteobacteria bacterium]